MSDLSEMRCEVCQVGSPHATQQEIDEFMPQLPGWEIIEENGVKKLRSHFRFANFEEALAFTNKVGELAEQQGHHPTLVTEWGEVTVTWWTHKIEGLHVNDFVMAAKTESLV